MDTKDTIIAVIFVTFRIFCDTICHGVVSFSVSDVAHNAVFGRRAETKALKAHLKNLQHEFCIA